MGARGIDRGATDPGGGATRQPRVRLLGDFELRLVDPISLPHSAQRLVAHLALERRPVSRVSLGGTLWPDARRPARTAICGRRCGDWAAR